MLCRIEALSSDKEWQRFPHMAFSVGTGEIVRKAEFFHHTCTSNPHEEWILQVGRNLSDSEEGFLKIADVCSDNVYERTFLRDLWEILPRRQMGHVNFGGKPVISHVWLSFLTIREWEIISSCWRCLTESSCFHPTGLMQKFPRMAFLVGTGILPDHDLSTNFAEEVIHLLTALLATASL
jgi:hypothetical protein